ncbi:hypothetical protein Adi01nite_78180 [Amorphoplanes digitatis]|nr:hypothetical protein Adi01nite_78180 [Actinoplanes digitatis]
MADLEEQGEHQLGADERTEEQGDAGKPDRVGAASEDRREDQRGASAAEDSADEANRLVAPLIEGVESLKFLDALVQAYDHGAP